ncbi:MAG TPA: hypothetical protein PKE00_16415 [Planctomycetota bacterium]|nr:hypothetical protein [Planctomycetota bacterium]
MSDDCASPITAETLPLVPAENVEPTPATSRTLDAIEESAGPAGRKKPSMPLALHAVSVAFDRSSATVAPAPNGDSVHASKAMFESRAMSPPLMSQREKSATRQRSTWTD